MVQTARSTAGRLPERRIIDAECWTVRGPAGPELRRAPRLKPSGLAGLCATLRRVLRAGS